MTKRFLSIINVIFISTMFLWGAPKITKAQESVVLGTYQTQYNTAGRGVGRAHNIKQASATINNYVIRPRQRFSFNEVVGERTRERGYRYAPVISSGRIIQGLGGGICQVASTIHASAIYAGLRIVDRSPHTRVSSYIRPGFDATVDWGSTDLIIENPYHFPVQIRITFTSSERTREQTIQVDILGSQRVYEIEIEYTSHILRGFETQTTVDETLPSGRTVVVESGTPATTVLIRRHLLPIVPGPTYQILYDVYRSSYNSSDRIVRTNPN
jgi:vancomycin resistance protein YoaR